MSILKRFTVGTIIAITMQILSILIMTNLITPEISEVIKGIVVAILQIAVLAGFLNNPTDKKHY